MGEARPALPLSVDNVAAGASLGIAGYSPWIAPILFGVTTFIMSIAGHQIGRGAAHFVPRIRTDLLTGVAFVAMRSWWSRHVRRLVTEGLCGAELVET